MPTVPTTSTPMITISLEIGMDGVTCLSYGTAEEVILNKAMASHIDGADSDDFGEHACTDVSRRLSKQRRALLNNGSVSINTEVSVDPAEHDDDVVGSITNAVATAVSSGALASSIQEYAEATGVTITITVTGVTATTMPPTAAPTGAPGKGGNLMGGTSTAGISAAVWIVVVCVVIFLGAAGALLLISGCGAASNKSAATPVVATAAAPAPAPTTELVAEADVTIIATPTELGCELGNLTAGHSEC